MKNKNIVVLCSISLLCIAQAMPQQEHAEQKDKVRGSVTYAAQAPSHQGCREKESKSEGTFRYKFLNILLQRRLADPSKSNERVELALASTGEVLCSGTWAECAQTIKDKALSYDPETKITQTTYELINTCHTEL
jgi:hypothetical protein